MLRLREAPFITGVGRTGGNARLSHQRDKRR
jgi:hypothetical protein